MNACFYTKAGPEKFIQDLKNHFQTMTVQYIPLIIGEGGLPKDDSVNKFYLVKGMTKRRGFKNLKKLLRFL